MFSLDLKAGQPLAASNLWDGPDAWHIAKQAIGLGVRRLLVLDLARVGVSAGTGTEILSAQLVTNFPEVEVLAGGGVRERGDLEQMRRMGIKGVLVASALHNGRLCREDVAS